MFRDLLIFFLGLLTSSALHVSGVVDAARWGRIINGGEVSDIADDVGDVVKEKLRNSCPSSLFLYPTHPM
ncbi:hypothetical protein [Acaryochloris sp. CCMEE 5410]|uniref:hypothetical protein n=1 Tax=Acaryochloris sp. CCMEE 5410 TaxID=310037 RepID=UPI0021CF1E35|nr:hypothetical protein [Acaryochloris sp. CCMEE 5410]KAI9129458.1 hypothetical protein ON05_035735 [Acaryochloris sp. CCMEE 5410]